MDYKPVTAVWEITMGCNMRCKHCGSACKSALPDELTRDEALCLCDDLGRMGFKWITLSGGEPTTRPDWYQIAARLHQNGIIPNMITNGWLIEEEIIEKAVVAQINTIAISLDGLRETHDSIRRNGSFDKIMSAFDLMKEASIHYSAITTINRKNIFELPELLQILEEKNVEGWQLQLGLPMGTMAQNRELVADPGCVDMIIEFAHAKYKATTVDIQLADCIGYYNAKELEVRQKGDTQNGYAWQGCGAGKTSMGILHNGEIVGCTSLREKEFIEGSIRKTSVQEIWNNPDSFRWNRNLKKENLSGFCSLCKYGRYCLGGCGNTRLTMSGSIYGENRYCSYHCVISKAEVQFVKNTSVDTVAKRAQLFISNKNFQLAESILRLGLIQDGNNLELLGLYGYVSYMLENFDNAKNANEKILTINSNDPFANKGMGLSLCKLERTKEGILFLQKAIKFANEDFMDPYYDLALVLLENNRRDEAKAILDEGRAISSNFHKKSEDLYEMLTLQS